MYDLKQVMLMSALSERTVRRHLKEGLLKGKKIGGIWRFTESDVINYINEDSTKQSKSKHILNLMIDTYHGVKGGESMIVIPIKKTTPKALKALSLEVSQYQSPFTFDAKTTGDKHIITFKGSLEDTKKLVDYIKSHFEQI